MESIIFKEQESGFWHREDDEPKKDLNHEVLIKEILQLVSDGWRVTPSNGPHIVLAKGRPNERRTSRERHTHPKRQGQSRSKVSGSSRSKD